MSSLDAILNQYQKNQKSNSDRKFVSNEDRLKKYFAAFLPKGQKEGESSSKNFTYIKMVPHLLKKCGFMKFRYKEDGKKYMDPGKNSDGSNLVGKEVH